MYIAVLWILTVVFIVYAFLEMNSHKYEWLILLLMLSTTKTIITYLFDAGTVFTLITIGSIQIHLDDVILIWLFLYCIYKLFFCPIRKSQYFIPILIYALPVAISLVRGIFSGEMDFSGFLGDTRKFILFLVVMLAAYLVIRNENAIYRADKMQLYVTRFMNCVLVYVLIVWALDLFLGMNSLPGQLGGTLSDGGSTFRIINPPQVLMIAFYTLYQVYKDLEERSALKLRTLLFIAVVILLQWRTVVAAFIVGLAIVIVAHFIKARKIHANLMLELVIIVVLLAVMILMGGGSTLVEMVQNLFGSYGNISGDTGTFSTRVSAWAELMGSLNGRIEIIFGKSFGYTDTSLSWTASAHSGYVDFIMVAGWFGCVCLILMLVYILIQCIRKKNIIMAAVVISLAVYWYGYGFSIEQAGMLGIMLGVLEHYDWWVYKEDDEELAEYEDC